jgi:hypothetical protein
MRWKCPSSCRTTARLKVTGHPHAARPPFRMGATLKAAAEPTEPRRSPSAAAAGETIASQAARNCPAAGRRQRKFSGCP